MPILKEMSDWGPSCFGVGFDPSVGSLDVRGMSASEWSCPARLFAFILLVSSLSISGRFRKIVKTFPASLNLGFQEDIWDRR